MSPGTIRTGLIGFGLAGRVFHGPFLAGHPAYSLDVVVTRDPARQGQVRSLHPDAAVVDGVDELFEADLDLVVLASPPATHVPLAERAIERGLSVVVDKPFCAASSDASRLLTRSLEAGVVLTVFHNRRWDADFLALKACVADGSLGEVRRFESRFERWKTSEAKAWRAGSGPSDAGGILYDLGSHLVDQALQLFGPASVEYAELRGTAVPGVDDDAFVVLRHQTGTVSHLWMSSVTGQVGPRFRALGSTSAFTSWGLDPQEPQLDAGLRPDDPAYGLVPEERWPQLGVDGRLQPVEPPRGDYAAFYRGLAAALTEDADPPVNPLEALDVVRTLEEVHRRFGPPS